MRSSAFLWVCLVLLLPECQLLLTWGFTSPFRSLNTGDHLPRMLIDSSPGLLVESFVGACMGRCYLPSLPVRKLHIAPCKHFRYSGVFILLTLHAALPDSSVDAFPISSEGALLAVLRVPLLLHLHVHLPLLAFTICEGVSWCFSTVIPVQ